MKHYYDITENEIKYIKSDILNFVSSFKDKFDIYEFTNKDIEFITYISKNIVFLKYQLSKNNNYIIEVLVSDLFNIMLSIFNQEKRYTYLNERSIIENYIRLSIQQVYPDTLYINSYVFDKAKSIFVPKIISQDDYSFIKSEYVQSCGYIHGSDVLRQELALYFDDLFDRNKNFNLNEKFKYYDRLIRLIKIFNKIIITNNTNFIDCVFHRKKTLLSYLVGNKLVDLLFDLR